MDFKRIIRDVPDFPIPGIIFRDVTTLLKDPAAFRQAIDTLVTHYHDRQLDAIASIESRGHIFAAPLAYALGVGLIPVRKPGKLPADKIQVAYQLEYGTERLEMHIDAVQPGQRILIVDDLIATGGSANAARQMVEQLGGEVAGFAFLIELTFLKGRETLQGYDVFSVIQY
ncbi:MAG: adenine phosphoribosyltransferase [Anaerolineae bacterium]|nr:adenine phosphoribosyltransferase [Anaerolineae bacterium]